MKELKNVLKRLQEEEVKLSSEKVDLAVTDDFRKLEQSANKESLKSVDLVDTAKGFIDKAIESKRRAISDYKDAIKSFEKIEALFKEIGVPVTDTLQKSIFSVKANMQDDEASLSSLEKAKGTIKR